MEKTSALKGAVFDLDGTLLDSMGIWEQIDIRFLQKRHLKATKDYVQAVTPMGFQQAAEYTISRFGLKESASAIIAEWNEMVQNAYAREITLKPHAKEYLLYLKQNGVKLGVATALTPNLYEAALKNNGVFTLFSAFSNLTEVRRGKGYPDIYLSAAKKLNIEPRNCVVFEDIADGIQGAKAGGFRTCGVYDRYSEYESEKIRSLSDRYITDFKELL